ncbi:MAG: CDC27 family protein [Pseudomonadota bacterium]|jgi:cytochrome c-type biogenesis protein CcmH/NrfG
MDSIAACGNCGAGVNQQMKFCSGCGRRLVARPAGFMVSGAVGAVVLLAVGLGLQMLARDGRSKPAAHPAGQAQTATAKQQGEESGASQSPQIVAMRSEVERAPEDISKLKVFAGMLGDHLRSNPNSDPQLVFEAIDVFGRILQKEPKDPAALVMMADVSFDQKAFTKALDFYERYLSVEPTDLGARSRYASTLTFLGRYDDSVRELGKVLTDDPQNFPAMAYLAITYAQKGEIIKAKAIGSDALKMAPSEDARARFSSFVASLDQAAVGDASQPVTAQQDNSLGLGGFVKAVQSNPVAGPKFAGYEQAGPSTLRLKFKDFPMGQMPPFAKQKFFTGLKESLAKNNLAEISMIEFIDATSGEIIERLKVQG